MNSVRKRPWDCAPAAVAAAVLLLAAPDTRAVDNPVTVRPSTSGMIELVRGKTMLAAVDLNIHGANWEYASQKDTKATITELPDGQGTRYEGIIAVPKSEGGPIRYTQTVTMLAGGFRVDYDLVMEKTAKLNGLQVSISLPVSVYAGREVLISRLDGDPTLVGLPKEHREGQSQLWSGEGAKIELAKETTDAVTFELLAATDVLVLDLRQWESPYYEIRFPAITENAGRQIDAGTRFHLNLTVSFGT